MACESRTDGGHRTPDWKSATPDPACCWTHTSSGTKRPSGRHRHVCVFVSHPLYSSLTDNECNDDRFLLHNSYKNETQSNVIKRAQNVFVSLFRSSCYSSGGALSPAASGQRPRCRHSLGRKETASLCLHRGTNSITYLVKCLLSLTCIREH